MSIRLPHLYGTLCAVALLCASCDDILDKTAKTSFMESAAYWSNVSEVSSYTNNFYKNFAGYGENGFQGWFYYEALSDDQVNPNAFGWKFYAVPARSGYWDDAFTQVRSANAVISNVASSSLPDKMKAAYTAIARLNRAWQYYQLVREYGDVPWTTDPLTSDEDKAAVCGDRTDRDIVMDSVLADLDFAIANLGEAYDKTRWSSDMALAIKSDVCLYEGTYCKYRTKADNGKAADKERAARYLRECCQASEALITSGKYRLTRTYGEIYNSLDLSRCPEVIFYRNYEKDVMTHGLVTATCATQEVYGLTRDAVDAFLFLDGRPKATTGLDSGDSAVVNADGDYSISHLLAVRDRRLSVITDSIVAFKGHPWCRQNDGGLDGTMTSATGYGIRKFDNTAMDYYYRTGINTNYTDAPLFWYAVILLNDAEALAELGSITQDDLDATVNLLQQRAGLPPMTLKPDRDPDNDMRVSSLIWEIRRTRRCELMCDNWVRYWDLVRWHQLDKLDSKVHPAVNRGAHIGGAGNAGAGGAGKTDFKGSAKAEITLDDDRYIIPAAGERTYKPKYYFFPIPTTILKLNPNIRQNPGWS